MKRSLSHGSGFFEIDHRDSPGIAPGDLPPNFLVVPGGQRLEADVQQCAHCERGVLLNQDRVRPRGYCPNCDHYICDGCEDLRVKVGCPGPMRARIDQAQAIAEKFVNQPDHPDADPAIVLTDLCSPSRSQT